MASPSSARQSERSKIGKLIRGVISPAIVGQTCPICLRNLEVRNAAVLTVCFHAYCLNCIRKWSDVKRKCPLCNSTFDSWFYKIDLYSRRFIRQQLGHRNPVNPRPPSALTDPRRIIRRTREEINNLNGRTRPLPRRRSFGRPSTAPLHVVAERKLQWRASVYNRRLQAVPPFTDGIRPIMNVKPRNDGEKQRILQRIEPWIRREMQALLGDPDPSIILHVVSSLFFSRHESGPSSRQLDVQDNFLDPLKPFLFERTKMFWHELRCFAECSLTMETYDAVVEYRQMEQLHQP